MLRFVIVGLFVAVFVSLPSVRTDDELTKQEVLEAVERALDGQLKDTDVQPTGDSEIEEFCDGNQKCKQCFATCDGDEQCAINCVLRIRRDDKDKQGSERKRWWGWRTLRRSITPSPKQTSC
ncbi:hypothetical protein MAR_011547 [Mya arenaria]|uniref:Uncharacterized protein n=1 Tax=Mya arenaria TaxID=6604 RepID=A0ABY7FUE9_MYAAR|nr:uncharacterized protein LOC128218435 [Mya arenaria]WAR25843.1 hypothetical protein MAR_011547 [Mya arenaria]